MRVQEGINQLRVHYARLNSQQKYTLTLIVALASCFLLAFLIKIILTPSYAKDPQSPLVICHNDRIEIPNHSPLRSQVVIRPVTVKALPHHIHVPGYVEADPAHTVQVMPPLAGRLLELKVTLGSHIKQGDTLAVISSVELARSYANYEKAKEWLNLMTDTLKRARRVYQAGANSTKDLELAENNYKQAVSDFESSKAQLNILGHQLNHHLIVTAPLSGTITTINVGIGTYITDTTLPLMTISNNDALWITANIPENFLRFIAVNQFAEVNLPAYPNEIFHGQISFINSYLNNETRRNQTRIRLSSINKNIQPNMFATVTLAIPQSKTVIVPKSALLMNNDHTTVFVEISPWAFVRRIVELGLEDKTNVRILAGLSPHDRIITQGGIFIND